jgi:alkanesulfonate monooxygenase SsuD/methylene tetrahydromethanopterin reductase-like flavin-dependent oxidoreductase (luciferase family)
MTKKNYSLGVVLSTVTDNSVSDIVKMATLAEKLGYDSVYVNEGRMDALACVQAIAEKTRNITLGTNIANIHYRHPFLTAATSKIIAEISKGRFSLGLGISHRGLLEKLDVNAQNGRKKLEEHTAFIKLTLAGAVGEGFLKPRKSPFKIPIYLAGNTVESASIAGAIGDGLMPYLTPREHLSILIDAARSAFTEPKESFNCILSIPTFISDDILAAISAARYNLAFFAQLPNYRRQWRRAGYGAAMKQLQTIWTTNGDRHKAAAAIPKELVEQVCLVGSPKDCKAQMEYFYNAGAEEILLAVSPVDTDRLSATEEALTLLV